MNQEIEANFSELIAIISKIQKLEPLDGVSEETKALVKSIADELVKRGLFNPMTDAEIKTWAEKFADDFCKFEDRRVV